MLPADEFGLKLTPYGFVPASHVFEVSANEIIGISNGRVIARDKTTGRIVADYGEISRQSPDESPFKRAERLCREHFLSHGIAEKHLDVRYPGYYASANVSRLQSFKTTWVVPDLPTVKVNKTFFIWNAADGGGMQPVLQWGNGTLAYQIANWAYVGGYFHGAYLPVCPGDILVGAITYIDGSGTKWRFQQSFEGYPEADLNVERPNDVSSVAQCYEPYTNEPNEWPASQFVAMKNICLKRRAGAMPVANLGWWISTSNNQPRTQNGKTTIIENYSSRSGEVDFYFH